MVTFAETRKISFDIETCESKSEVIITWALEGKNGPKGSLSLTSSQDIEEYEVCSCFVGGIAAGSNSSFSSQHQVPTLEANLEHEQAKLATLENQNLIADSEAKIKQLEVRSLLQDGLVGCLPANSQA